ncbi:MAG: S-layer domain protein [Methanothrix harundinacea]|jgi:hypothetical protein|uniref:S-layer domain protein n=1 Tax=Methanothrix harundinacea TaxID=301375 RepID=A0A101IGJ3_9EURY|nr:MAG: S-layer domain protein [Methanothrix harundinacea]
MEGSKAHPTPDDPFFIFLRLERVPIFAFLFIALIWGSPVCASTFQIDVQDFGAEGDGETDDTYSFQRALENASEKGGVVYIPPGIYRFDGTLTIPDGVAMQGTWVGPHTAELNKGSTFLVYSGRGDENSTPFISLESDSTLKGVTIFYPEQKVDDIRPYPWTIQGSGTHFNVIDVTIANAYNGIDCGTFWNEAHHLRNVHMCALRRGVFVDQCTDIGRLENVHIHTNYWARVSEPYALDSDEEAALWNYTKKHLEGFIIGRTDWEYISDCFVIFANVGFHFNGTSHGLANALITQSGSDIGPLAVKIDKVQPHAGVAFENCQFMSGFEIGPHNWGPVKLTNCGFWGYSDDEFDTGSQMILNGQGTVMLTATHFNDWDWTGEGKACIEVLNGSLLMSNCDFRGFDEPFIYKPLHVYIGPNVKSAAIIGNRFQHGRIGIVNESRGEIEVAGNVRA